MINITHKSPTLRKAIAQAIVCVSKPETIFAIKNRSVPKGDVLEMAKTAGLFAAKRTADMIPDCHPLPIEFTSVSYEIGEMEIQVLVEVHTVYKTGVEVEAMHAASVVALTMYDMLKPIDKGISIQHIKLMEKRGGKSDQKADFSKLRAAVVVCSDSISKGLGEDKSGKTIIGKLEGLGIQVTNYVVIPDDSDKIQNAAHDAVAQETDILIFTGGTGLSPRDITPEALEPILTRRIPGIEEAIRSYGQQRVPTAMLSRSVAGTIGKMLVLALPGSAAAAGESMDAIFPAVLHVFHILGGGRH
jgi:molybdenum cofactor biosynthesis protein MoaC